VHVNAATCWLYGVDAVNTSLMGLGERTGNPPLEGALFELAGLKGDDCGIDFKVITALAEYYEREIGLKIAANYPFVGSECMVTRAGIHAEGLRRDERIYNIFDTVKILGRAPQVAITDKSGADGVAFWVNRFLGRTGADQLSKIKVHKIARWVVDQYEIHGRTSVISGEEMAEQVRLHLPDEFKKRAAAR